MTMETTMLYLYVETPLHAGVGSGLSSIDLPIQRERTTQYPMIQGSGIKGKLRAIAEDMKERKQAPFDKDDNLVAIMFGPENGSDHAGALITGDARLLLFPVRSLNGVFAYTTSYDILNRFIRDASRGKKSLDWNIPEAQKHTAIVTSSSRITVDDTVVLEEFSFTVDKSTATKVDAIAKWIAENALPQPDEKTPQLDKYAYWRDKVKNSLVILPEDDFRDFVINATEIITRISIDRKTKTATGKALWTEEHLPTDTLLYVPMYATDSRKARDKEKSEKAVPASDILLDAISLEDNHDGYIQLGGDETVGRGIVRMHWENNKPAQQSTQNDERRSNQQ